MGRLWNEIEFAVVDVGGACWRGRRMFGEASACLGTCRAKCPQSDTGVGDERFSEGHQGELWR